MEINGEAVDLHMKLGDNGAAFFVQETANAQVRDSNANHSQSKRLTRGHTHVFAEEGRDACCRLYTRSHGSSNKLALCAELAQGPNISPLAFWLEKRDGSHAEA